MFSSGHGQQVFPVSLFHYCLWNILTDGEILLAYFSLSFHFKGQRSLHTNKKPVLNVCRRPAKSNCAPFTEAPWNHIFCSETLEQSAWFTPRIMTRAMHNGKHWAKGAHTPHTSAAWMEKVHACTKGGQMWRRWALMNVRGNRPLLLPFIAHMLFNPPFSPLLHHLPSLCLALLILLSHYIYFWLALCSQIPLFIPSSLRLAWEAAARCVYQAPGWVHLIRRTHLRTCRCSRCCCCRCTCLYGAVNYRPWTMSLCTDVTVEWLVFMFEMANQAFCCVAASSGGALPARNPHLWPIFLRFKTKKDSICNEKQADEKPTMWEKQKQRDWIMWALKMHKRSHIIENTRQL